MNESEFNNPTKEQYMSEEEWQKSEHNPANYRPAKNWSIKGYDDVTPQGLSKTKENHSVWIAYALEHLRNHPNGFEFIKCPKENQTAVCQELRSRGFKAEPQAFNRIRGNSILVIWDV